MKKLFITLCVAFVTLCASAQQKGTKAIGLNLGLTPCLESGASITNIVAGAKFQYNVANAVRLESSLNYGFKDKDISVLELSENIHYLFKLNDEFNMYPLVGLGYGLISYSADVDTDYGIIDVSGSENRLLLNLGIGAECKLTANLSIGAEIKYQYMKDFTRLPISMGVTYRF